MTDKATRYVVMQELSDGNAEVGSMWISTATFGPETTLNDIFDWVYKLRGHRGRLMVTEDQNHRRIEAARYETARNGKNRNET